MIIWGVRQAEGVVVRAYDGPRAFVLEAQLRERGWHDAQAVVSRDAGWSWRLVPFTSVLRPGPRVPRVAASKPAPIGWAGRRWEAVLAWLGVGMRPDCVPVGGGWRRLVRRDG